MGVSSGDCRKVAELIGIKTFINEFVAYTQLTVFINNTDIWNQYNGSYTQINDDIILEDANRTLVGGIMEVWVIKLMVHRE